MKKDSEWKYGKILDSRGRDTVSNTVSVFISQFPIG